MPNLNATIDLVGQGRSCVDPQNEQPPSIGYVRQLRRECQQWRLKLADAERENARLKIALILLENGPAHAKTGEGV